jgi:hypothetical protein
MPLEGLAGVGVSEEVSEVVSQLLKNISAAAAVPEVPADDAVVNHANELEVVPAGNPQSSIGDDAGSTSGDNSVEIINSNGEEDGRVVGLKSKRGSTLGSGNRPAPASEPSVAVTTPTGTKYKERQGPRLTVLLEGAPPSSAPS